MVYQNIHGKTFSHRTHPQDTARPPGRQKKTFGARLRDGGFETGLDCGKDAADNPLQYFHGGGTPDPTETGF